MHAFRLFWDKEDYKLEKNVPGLTRSTFTASACVRLFNISKMQLFVCFSTRDKRMVVAKNSNTREARVNVGLDDLGPGTAFDRHRSCCCARVVLTTVKSEGVFPSLLPPRTLSKFCPVYDLHDPNFEP